MKESIDLTESRDFSKGIYTVMQRSINPADIIPKRKYIPKTLPWEKTEPGEPAEKKTGHFKTIDHPLNTIEIGSHDDINSITFSPQFNWFADANEVRIFNHDFDDFPIATTTVNGLLADTATHRINEWNVVSHVPELSFDETTTEDEDDIPFTSTPSISSSSSIYTTTSTSLSNSFGTATLNVNGKTYYFNYNNEWGDIETLHEFVQVNNKNIFPTGHRDEIKERRVPYNWFETPKQKRIQNRKATSNIHCGICGKLCSRTAWDKAQYVKTHRCLSCEEMRSRTKHPWDNDILGRDFKRFMLDEQIMHDMTHESVPCLSSDLDIPSFYKRKRTKEDAVIDWEYETCYDSVDSHLKNLHDKARGYTGMWGFSTDKVCNLLYHGKYAVKYKGREIKRREEAWQPNGRVEQEYDKFFDKVNWRDLIRKQIKEELVTNESSF